MKELFTVSAEQNGSGNCTFQWSNKGTLLAVCGSKRRVAVYDRNGRLYDEILLPAPENVKGSSPNDCSVLALSWSAGDDMLAILQTGSNNVLLWKTSSREASKLDTNMKELSALGWSRTGATLAVGTAKGNLLIYNSNAGKKVPIIGKHTRKISAVSWSKSGLLVLGADDKAVSISTAEGDTLKQLALKGEPAECQFNESSASESTLGGARAAASSGRGMDKFGDKLSINVGRQTLFLYRFGPQGGAGGGAGPGGADERPLELAFSPKYGSIVTHQWFGEGYVLIGFSTGYVVVISTHNQEIQEEVHSKQYITSGVLTDLVYNSKLQRAAVVGGEVVRILDLSGQNCIELEESSTSLKMMECTKAAWTADGQVLTVASNTGYVMTLLASLPTLHGAHATQLCYLTSLLELSVLDVTRNTRTQVEIETEPAFLAMGAYHVAVGINNQAWIYRIATNGDQSQQSGAIKVNQRDYLGTVDEILLNDHIAAVRSEGRVQLHTVEMADDPREEQDLLLPESGMPFDISCIGLSQNFLIYGTRRGSLHYFLLEDRVAVNEFKHDEGAIIAVYPNHLGTRLVFLDERQNLYLYHPVNDQLIPVSGFKSTPDKVLWDADDQSTLVVSDASNFYTFVYASVSINGPQITHIATTPRAHGQVPVLVSNGMLWCQVPAGKMERVLLVSHTALQDADRRRQGLEAARMRFKQSLALLRFKDAWDLAATIKQKDTWSALAEAALIHMNVALAMRVHRHIGNAGIVIALEKILPISDKNLLAGHICVLMGTDYGAAQDFFLKSNRPLAALEMRKDLKDWEEALKLAQQLDPSQMGEISREYASLLELRGEYDHALAAYERAAACDHAEPQSEAACQAGIARMVLHLGDLRRGRQLALESGSLQLCRECAGILEGMNQLQDAAELYERGHLYEKAASIYIMTKSFSMAQPLMAKISTPKLHTQYARAKEAEKQYQEAATAFEMAKDMDNVVRLSLEKLNDPQRAFAIVRRTRSSEGAALVAQHCRSTGDYPAAIEFLLMARRAEEAFELGQAHNEMDTYVRILGDGGTPEEYTSLAKYYETLGKLAKAGDLYAKCSQHAQALRLYLRCGASELDKAIEVVGKAQNDMLTNQLVDFLMGETDGIEKDHNHLFRLYMALRNYERAAHTAVLIARQEQEMGNYKIAHSTLFDTHRELSTQGRKVPAELTRNLTLLHSYIIVKTLIKLNDHKGAAQMLIRVAKNISKFPAHIVPILTSTVIKCAQAGYKKTAYDYASMLMRPEYRSQIADAYKRKIETIVRKPDKEAKDEEEVLAECPFCQELVSETDLDCNNCRNVIPFCIATGKAMTLAEWSQCPSCKFPCNAQAFVKLIAQEKNCPMCAQQVVLSAIRKVPDPVAALKAYTARGATGSGAE